MDHVVRRGAIVVFPVYQSGILDIYQTPNAAYATARALDLLETGDLGVRPDMGRILYAGHSAGGGIAVNLAALSAQDRVPRPFAVLAAEPGANLDPANPGAPDPLGIVADWAEIPETTHVVVAVGDRDSTVGDEPATAIWEQTRHLPDARRHYQVLRSSIRHPVPALATHLAPLGARRISIPNLFDTSAYDWLLWATLDELVDCSVDPDATTCPVPDRLPGWEWSDGVAFPPADTYAGEAVPPRIPVTAGNASAYVFYPIFEVVAPLCPFLGGLCGTPPPPG